MDTSAIQASYEDRMQHHSRAITEAFDFPNFLWTTPEDVRHHVKMLSMLAYGMEQLNKT